MIRYDWIQLHTIRNDETIEYDQMRLDTIGYDQTRLDMIRHDYIDTSRYHQIGLGRIRQIDRQAQIARERKKKKEKKKKEKKKKEKERKRKKKEEKGRNKGRKREREKDRKRETKKEKKRTRKKERKKERKTGREPMGLVTRVTRGDRSIARQDQIARRDFTRQIGQVECIVQDGMGWNGMGQDR